VWTLSRRAPEPTAEPQEQRPLGGRVEAIAIDASFSRVEGLPQGKTDRINGLHFVPSLEITAGGRRSLWSHGESQTTCRCSASPRWGSDCLGGLRGPVEGVPHRERKIIAGEGLLDHRYSELRYAVLQHHVFGVARHEQDADPWIHR
jgi:hypothetical protein